MPGKLLNREELLDFRGGSGGDTSCWLSSCVDGQTHWALCSYCTDGVHGDGSPCTIQGVQYGCWA